MIRICRTNTRRVTLKHIVALLALFFIVCIVFIYKNINTDYEYGPVKDDRLISDFTDEKTKHDKISDQSKSPIIKKDKSEPTLRSTEILKAMKHSWKAYVDFAWGKDEVYPLTNGSSVWMGAALTMIDSLDLLYIMNLKSEFKDCIKWIEDNLHFDLDKAHVNVFETTIRVLGGLLSSYELSNETILLNKALDLGDRLSIAFDTPTGIPLSDINLKRKEASNPEWTTLASTAEAYTVILELYELSRLSKKPEFLKAANKIIDVFHKAEGKNHGLVPIYIDPNTGAFNSHTITLGARGDSYYEYLLKYWIMTGKKNDQMKNDYLQAVEGIQELLVKQSVPNKLVYIAELLPDVNPKMDHLVCFLPGLLALGHMHGMPQKHLELAEELIKTCHLMYSTTATGLSPEIAYFNTDPNFKTDIIIKDADKFNLQRPETIESLFYLHRITKDRKYADWAWDIFQSFEKYSKVPWAGYVSIGDVQDTRNVRKYSKCESFWYSETLKYFYLLFIDYDYHNDTTLFPFDSYVFNTEGHPFPITVT